MIIPQGQSSVEHAIENNHADSALFRLDHKVVAITGAAGGIGKAIADLFAARGAHVRIVDLSIGEAERVVAEIVHSGGHAEAVHCDVADIESGQGAFQRMIHQ